MLSKFTISFLGICSFIVPAAVPALELPALFGDNMVLQRDKPLPVWGHAESEQAIIVAFNGRTNTTQALADGTWRVDLAAESASTSGRILTVTAGDEAIVITNVLVGDVWLCSGQSNMEWPLFRAHNGQAIIEHASNEEMRLLFVKKASAAYPGDSIEAAWSPVHPQSVESFSAVGYFFGRELHRELSVPIGLIQSVWGGTAIQSWTNPEGWRQVEELADNYANHVAKLDPCNPAGHSYHLKKYDEIRRWLEDARAAVLAGTYPPPAPDIPFFNGHTEATYLYNGMIHPLIPFAIRGVIWYQGESNANEGLFYRHRMEALIKGWRDSWGQGDFPFYFVQLANYQTVTNKEPAMNSDWGPIREAQRLALAVTNTGMAVIIDVGDAQTIHPANKQDVGGRLATLALAGEYGRDQVPCGPLYRDFEVHDGKLFVAFDHAGRGLMAGVKTGLNAPEERPIDEVNWLSISGSDGVWHWADAAIEGDRLVVSSPDVPEPIAVRYATVMNPTGALLYNREGFPASPFATDTE